MSPAHYAHLSQSVLGDGLKSLLHVDGFLGRGLEVGNLVLNMKSFVTFVGFNLVVASLPGKRGSVEQLTTIEVK